MLFMLIAKDGNDAKAYERRMAERERHINLSEKAIKKGEQLLGCALIDQNERMCGSVMLVDFKDRESLNEWLKTEPYVVGNVWQDIEIYPCRIGPSFQSIFEKPL